MGLEQNNERRARKVLVHPGGAYRILERIYNGGHLLSVDDAREAVLLIAPHDDPADVRIHGFRVQDAISPGLNIGPEWDVDNVGYNFDYLMSPDMLDERGRAYDVAVVFTVNADTPNVSTYEIRREYEIQAGSGPW